MFPPPHLLPLPSHTTTSTAPLPSPSSPKKGQGTLPGGKSKAFPLHPGLGSYPSKYTKILPPNKNIKCSREKSQYDSYWLISLPQL